MKKIDSTEIDNALNDFPINLARLINESLDTKNSGKKLTARSTLVRMDKTIIPQLHRLLDSKNGLIAFAAITVACDTEQGMMYGSGGSMDMGNWNWVQILIGIVIGFLLGYLVARRRK